jgi:hypothetical protein
MRVEVLSTVSHHSVELKAGIFINVDVREAAFLCNGEVLTRWVNGNGADSVCVLALEHLLFLCIDVVYLIGVTSGVDNHVIGQVMQVEALK